MWYEAADITNREPRSMIRRITLFFACLFFASQAPAASSDWFETQGGAVRLVTSGISNEQGHLRGALQIRLEPGWKTYWRDPGKTGIPPQIELTGGGFEGVELLYPAPRRFKDPYGDWPGYGESVTLPAIFKTTTPGTAPLVEAEVFLGICETVCIPLQASFTFDASAGADNPMDAFTVQSSFNALPVEARAGFRIARAEHVDDSLILHAELPAADGEAYLFLSAEGGQLTLLDPAASQSGKYAFEAQVITAPEPGANLHYTLVQEDMAVSGTIPFPAPD
jgi:DsbC/DsbD-like thiol-disulfide interchange protein